MAIAGDYKTSNAGETLWLEVTNGHKDRFAEIAEAYGIKDNDPTKVLSFLTRVAIENKGKPLGSPDGRFLSPPPEWSIA